VRRSRQEKGSLTLRILQVGTFFSSILESAAAAAAVALFFLAGGISVAAQQRPISELRAHCCCVRTLRRRSRQNPSWTRRPVSVSGSVGGPPKRSSVVDGGVEGGLGGDAT
jgi:hypothetical protein